MARRSWRFGGGIGGSEGCLLARALCGVGRGLSIASLCLHRSGLAGDRGELLNQTSEERQRVSRRAGTKKHRVENTLKEFQVRPTPDDPRLSQHVSGIDHEGKLVETDVVTERPLTLFLNAREIVTMMTIGDHPDLLAVGFLLNQGMLKPDDVIRLIDYDADISTVVVRTERETNYEDKLKKKVQTSGCAQGTVFGDLMEEFDSVRLSADARIKTSWLYQLTKKINTQPSLYLKAGAIHGCVLCQEDRPLVYMEDVGRHNAIDKIAGYMLMNKVAPDDKIFYTTGRLTSEMVIKCVKMRIPILVSRSGFTAWGVELARKAGLTLIGRARGKRFLALSGPERIVFDADPNQAVEEDRKSARKGSFQDADGMDADGG
jgi:FdhD protein